MARAKAVGANTPAPPAPEYPGIAPLFRYRYDPKFTCDDLPRLRKIPNNPDAAWSVKSLVVQPVYGIYQVEIKGNPHVVEGGFLWQLMHDFCAGMVVSSAWVEIAEVPEPARSWDPSWCRQFYCERAGVTDHRQCAWSREKARIPHLEAFTGPNATPTAHAALTVMRRSVGAAMITLGHSLAKAGIFVGDKTDESAQTSPLLKLGAEQPFVFSSLPTFLDSPKRLGRKAVINSYWPYARRLTNATFGHSPGYYNPNTDRTVALSWAMLDLRWGAAPRPVPPVTELPETELKKIMSGNLYPLLPQSVFSNH